MDNNTSVYKITAPNGKAYIGITNNIKIRWKNHRYTDYPIGRAIRAHGNSMVFEVLVEDLCRKDACVKEIELIKELGTLSPNGYNLKEGGEGIGSAKLSGESRERMSNAQLKRVRTISEIEAMHKNLKLGRGPCSEKNKKLMSKIHKGKIVKKETIFKANCKRTFVTYRIHYTMIDLCRFGLSVNEISNHLGVTRMTVARWLNKPIGNSAYATE